MPMPNKVEEIRELKSCLKIVRKQLRDTDRDLANCKRDIREYQEYFKLQGKLQKKVK